MVNPSMKSTLDYKAAKIEHLHDEVTKLVQQVDELRQEQAGRKAVQRFTFAVLGVIGATLGWLIDNALSMAKNIKF